jgi:hypothetical protein
MTPLDHMSAEARGVSQYAGNEGCVGEVKCAAHANTPASYGGAGAQPGGGGSNTTEILAGLDRSTAWLGAPRVASRAASA